MHAIAHEDCTDAVRQPALKVDSGRKIPCRTGESNLPQRRAGPTLYQLSYIPTPKLKLREDESNENRAHAKKSKPLPQKKRKKKKEKKKKKKERRKERR